MNGKRHVETRTISAPEPSKAWREANPGLSAVECPENELEFVVYLALVVTFEQVTQPNPALWPQRVKPLRELYREPMHEVFGGLPEHAAPLVVPA